MTLNELVIALRKIDLKQDENHIIAAVKPLAKQAIENHNTWFEERFYEVDEAQGFGSHLIYENKDHTLAVIITAWPKGRETPPHDHDTWAVIGSIKGVEQNTLWERHDDRSNPNYADISRAKAQRCQLGDIISMRSHEIHSVMNPEDNVSVSLHIYGKHFNHTNRYQFDPITKIAKPFIVRQTVTETVIA